MILKQQSLVSILKSIKILNGLLFVLSLSALALVLFLFSKKGETKISVGVFKEKKLSSHRFDHPFMGTGPLSLVSKVHRFPFSDLNEEIVLLSRNTRPDATVYETKLQIGLKGTETTTWVHPEQISYLACIGNHLTFSDQISPLWIKPFLRENGQIWLQMGMRLPNSQGKALFDEILEFQIKEAVDTKEILDPELRLASRLLAKGKWWGPDQLLESYGGEEFQKFKGQERMEIFSDQGKQVLFMSHEDTFIWKDDQWVPSTETKGFPMGKVFFDAAYKMRWQLWDKGGTESIVLTFKKESAPPISSCIKEGFKHFRKRTSSRISCRIDNRPIILKEGDWLIHTQSGWHIVKDPSEIEELLTLDIQGDLFIFDRLGKEEEQDFLYGTLFNSMRTEKESVRLPIVPPKNINSKVAPNVK